MAKYVKELFKAEDSNEDVLEMEVFGDTNSIVAKRKSSKLFVLIRTNKRVVQVKL